MQNTLSGVQQKKNLFFSVLETLVFLRPLLEFSDGHTITPVTFKLTTGDGHLKTI